MFAALALAAALGFTPATAGRIDDIVQTEISNGRAPGIAVGVVESGRIIYARGYGKASISRDLPVSPATQFGIGQVSEEFTAAALLLLEQGGKIKLDDAVAKYLPDVTVARSVTIRQLLQETSGLPLVSNWPHAIADANRQKPLAPPGTVYKPNPLNYLLAGLVVEKITGIPLSDYVQQQIFLPLVMDSSLYAGDTGISSAHAVGYTVHGDGFRTAFGWSQARTAGDSGVISNVYDLAKWDIEFPILLRDQAVGEMFAPSLPGAFDRHAMGWTIDQRSGKSFVWQNGEVPGYHAMNALLPDDHIAVIVLVNTDTFGGPATLPEDVAGRILDVLVPSTEQHVENAIVTRARDWIAMLASGHIDRAQLTPDFNSYLTDGVVRDAGIGALGSVVSMVPISSVPKTGGAVQYEFLVHFTRGVRHYLFTLAGDGRVAFISFSP